MLIKETNIPATKALRASLILLEIFLAATAIAGGIGLFSGVLNPGLELLKGSPFYDYTIPGLVLFLMVGGSAALAAGLMIRSHPLGVFGCGLSGIFIIFFEIVEVLVIGTDPGIARSLQVFYFSLGLLLLFLAARLWVSTHAAAPKG